MVAEKHEFITLKDFLEKYEGLNYEAQAKQAWHAYRTTLSVEDYVIITVKSYYCITKVKWWNVDTTGIERPVIDNIVRPFDSERVYPIQEIKKEFDWS